MRVGLAIRRAREAAGLSQSDVAKRLGCQPHNINDLEAGRRGASVERLVELARIFGVDAGELLGWR